LLRPVSAHGCGAKTPVDRLEILDLDPICTVGKRGFVAFSQRLFQRCVSRKTLLQFLFFL
jgi:hypothetical protein